MKQDYTHITMVVDRSGSMGTPPGFREEAQAGVNRFIKAHKEAPGSATFLLTQFDDQHDTVYEGDIASAPEYELVPRGWTALLDAVGSAIKRTGEFLAAMPEEDRPATVIFGYMTDGMENRSREYTWAQVLALIDEHTAKYGWDFAILGTNIDAAKTGRQMGVTNSFQFQPTGSSMSATMDSYAGSTVSHRVARSKGATAPLVANVNVDADGNVKDTTPTASV